jgi:hypothetical protein
MSGQTISTSDTKLSVFNLQSSCYGGVIPMAWGVCQLSGNIVWYGGFKSVATTKTQGGKGGVTQTSTSYAYQADVMMGLANTRISGITRIWKGKSLYSGGVAPSSIVTVTESWTTPSSGTMTYSVGHLAAFASWGGITRSFTAPDGKISTIPLQLGTDYTQKAGVVTVVNTALYSTPLQVTYQYTNTTPATTALDDLGMTLIPGDLGQTPWSGLASYGSQSIGYSGCAMVAAQAYPLGSDASIENHLFEGVCSWAYHLGSTVPDVDPSVVMREMLSSARGGANFPATSLDTWQSWSDYCVANNLLVSPVLKEQVAAADLVDQATKLTNSAAVWSGGRLKIIPYGDAAATAHGRTFTPDTTPIYDLDDGSWTPANNGSPLTYEVKLQTDRKNHFRVEYLDRSQQYAVAVAEARDLTDISVNGLQSADILQAHWICDGAIATHVAQLLLQRSLYVLTTYKAPLPWHFALLEPMDLVTLTDVELEMDHVPVRLTAITENSSGDLTIEAEDYPAGTSSATLYVSQAPLGYQHDYNADPGLCDTPAIFEVPYTASNTGLGLYIGVRGSQSPVNANWAGAQVWVSLDGTNYRLAGVAEGAARYGQLAGTVLPANTTIPVTGLSSQLISGTANDAATLTTLCAVLGAQLEYFAYQTATLTGTGSYTLGGLNRGAYATTTLETHSSGDRFVRVDSALVQSEDLDPSYIGKTVYVKLCPYNLYGGHLYSLADVSAYTYTITGSQYVRGLGHNLRVVARGLSDTTLSTTAAGVYDLATGSVVPGTSTARSYNVLKVLRAAPYTMTFVGTFDVYASPTNATAMAAALNALDNTVVVAIWTYDEPQLNRLASGLDAAMYRCGASAAVFGSPNFKSRGAYVLVGIPGIGAGGGAEMYNGDIDSSTNAWVDLSFSVGPDGFVVSGSTSTPRTLKDYSYTGDLNAAAATFLIARGICTTSGSTISANTPGSTWNAGDCYSAGGYSGGAYASASAAQTNSNVMFGLNTDPTADESYTSLDAAWYLNNDATCYIYESGTAVAGPWPYATDAVFTVMFDGNSLIYLQNGVVRRTTVPTGWSAMPASMGGSSAQVYFDSAFSTFNAIGSIKGVEFGPMSAVSGIGTNQLVNGAATDLYVDTWTGGTFTPGTTTTTVRSFVVTPTANCTIEFTATADIASVNSDNGDQAFWQVTPAGGSRVALAGMGGSGARATYTAACLFTAAAGVALTFEMTLKSSSATPSKVFTITSSSMRVTAVKR